LFATPCLFNDDFIVCFLHHIIFGAVSRFRPVTLINFLTTNDDPHDSLTITHQLLTYCAKLASDPCRVRLCCLTVTLSFFTIDVSHLANIFTFICFIFAACRIPLFIMRNTLCAAHCFSFCPPVQYQNHCYDVAQSNRGTW